MRRPGTPLFLQRMPYRRRRKIDAAWLLPVLGAFLLLLPILWAAHGGEGRRIALDGLYLFFVWGGLIGAARLLAPGLSAPETSPGGRRPGADAADAERGEG